MPEPARLTSPFSGYPLTVSKLDVQRVQLLVRADGNGEAVLPIRHKISLKEAKSGSSASINYVYVLNVPGSALAVMATMISARRGFTVNIDTQAFVGTFMFLSVK
jgi:hypothetical protein